MMKLSNTWNKVVSIILGLVLSIGSISIPVESIAQSINTDKSYISSNESAASFIAGLQTSLIPDRAYGSSTATYTANSTRYQQDFEGKYNLALANEARFQGARRVANLLGSAAISNASWTKRGFTLTSSTITAPDGTATAYRVTEDNTNANPAVKWTGAVSPTTTAKDASVWLKSTAPTTIGLSTTGGALGATISLTTSWQRFSVTQSAADASDGMHIGGYSTVVQGSGVIVDIWHPLEELVVGQANQNPSEWVDPNTDYGAGVNGVKYFQTLNGNTVASNVVTEATGAAINSSNAKFGVGGIANANFTTPNSAATDNGSGALEIIVKVAALYSSSSAELLLDSATGGTLGYNLNISNGILRWGNGGAGINSSAHGVPDNTLTWFKITSTGSGGTLTFYKSVDGVTWTAIGSPTTDVTRTASAGPVYVGTQVTGTAPVQGNIYYVSFAKSIGGTPTYIFNPNLSTTAQTFTAATGEVWTTNGTALIYGNTNATYGAPAQWDASGPYGYLAEGARADVLGTTAAIRRTMSDVGWVISTAGADITVTTTVGVDGVTASGARLTANANNATILFTPGLAGAIRTYSAWAKRITGTGAVSMTVDVADGYAAQTLTAAYAQYQTTSSSAVPVVGFKIATSGDVIDVDFNTLEAATFANPTPIPVNVSKAADSLTYASAGNVIGTAGTAYAEVTMGWTGIQNNNGRILELDSAGNRPALYAANSTGLKLGSYDGTNALLSPALTASNSISKVASAWGGSTKNNYVNGTTGAGGNFDGDFNVGANFAIGIDGSGTSPWNGTIRQVRIWPVALPFYKLQWKTTDSSDWLSDPWWRYADASNDSIYRIAANS